MNKILKFLNKIITGVIKLLLKFKEYINRGEE